MSTWGMCPDCGCAGRACDCPEQECFECGQVLAECCCEEQGYRVDIHQQNSKQSRESVEFLQRNHYAQVDHEHKHS